MKVAGSTLGKEPRICAVITGKTSRSAVEKALKDGADFVELRVDALKTRDPERVAAVAKEIKAAKAGLIVTVRSHKEGAEIEIKDSERLALFERLAPLADAIDIELSSKAILKEVVKAAGKHKAKVIVSYHNFTSTPASARLIDVVKRGRAAGADIVKIAAMVKRPGDTKRLAALLASNDDLIVIGMGERGASTRVFFPLLGSLITYAGLGKATAPGQLGLKELKREITRYTI